MATVLPSSRESFVRRWAADAIGGVPPFGHKSKLRIFIDPDLLQHDEVWAAAGTWHDVFAFLPADLLRVSCGTVTDPRYVD